MKAKEIIVVGGGFAGLRLIKKLKNRFEFNVTLVDINNYNFFPPLLYQVATGFMEPSAISYPFRRILRGSKNVTFRMGTLEFIDVHKKEIRLNNGILAYDILVLATGAVSNFFGNRNIEKFSIPMKTISDALAMRNFMLKRMEKATRISDVEEKRKLLSVVIAGAGPTGVELAGMFAEMRKNVIRRDYPDLKISEMGDITLVDGAPSVLAPMSRQSQQYTYNKLEEMGVKIILKVLVNDYDGETVTLSNQQKLTTYNLIWSAGVSSRVFDGLPETVYGRGKRLIVDGFNKVEGLNEIYAVGDTCVMTADEAFPNGHPQVAQPAIQQANNLGENLMKPQTEWIPFRYHDKGSMAIIGRNKAVADLPKPSMHLNGFLAWFVWAFIHIMSLVNFRNKLRAMYNWVGYYLTNDQTFRMIIEPERKKTDN